jgi:hypothetical protein
MVRTVDNNGHIWRPGIRDTVARHRIHPIAHTMALRKQIHHTTINAADGAVMGQFVPQKLLFYC